MFECRAYSKWLKMSSLINNVVKYLKFYTLIFAKEFPFKPLRYLISSSVRTSSLSETVVGYLLRLKKWIKKVAMEVPAKAKMHMVKNAVFSWLQLFSSLPSSHSGELPSHGVAYVSILKFPPRLLWLHKIVAVSGKSNLSLHNSHSSSSPYLHCTIPKCI